MPPTAQSNPLRTTISSPASTASRLRTRVTEIDEETEALESRLRLLAAERHRVLQDLSSITYPVLTLPPEITAQIFTHYLHKPHIGRTRPLHQGRGPLILASICRDWRHICLSIRSVWASLQVYPEQYSNGNVEDLLSLLRCWLSRAGSHPLDLHVFRSSSGSISWKIFTLLSNYSSQWRSLGVTLQRPFSFPNEKIQARIPCLEKLAITIIKEGGDVPLMMTVWFSVAPRLREVILSGASLQWISLPWIQLTHLDFRSESTSACVEILKQTPMLEALVVSLPYIGIEHPPSPPLILPHLHTLDFEHDRDGALLSCLTLPALKTLVLSCFRYEFSPRLRDLGVRSAWSLRSIILNQIDDRTSTFCLRCIPSLEEVKISFSASWSEARMEALVDLLAHDNDFLPALRALAIIGCVITDSPSALVEMLASRWKGDRSGIARLQSFHVVPFDQTTDAEYLEEFGILLEPLMNEGLEVVLGSL
ncbi:hypothetical protein C8R44DRAFT_302041 [Mycena epipterygia]|nr:hypothetical protein C8R44DRAFT_302041 [Mycena epipterygia]